MNADDYPAITIKNLTKKYANKTVLNNINLTIPNGTFGAIMGPNGSGKSTLLKILGTLSRTTKDTAFVFQYDVTLQPAKVRSQIGYLYQQVYLDPNLTVEENLIFCGKLFGMPTSTIKKRALYILDLFSFAEIWQLPVKTLSGGMQRLVDITRALLHEPRLLLLDEPTQGLDPDNRQIFISHLKQLHADQAVTVLFSSHHADELAHCNEYYALHNGHLRVMQQRDMP